MSNVHEVNFRNPVDNPSVQREMTRWERIKERTSAFFKYRVRRKLPYLVWYGERIWVRVQLTEYGIGGDLSTAWKAEDALKANGVTFDTGTGGVGRDWEWDWSLKGPIQITFRGKP